MKYKDLSKEEQELYEEFVIDIVKSIIKKGKTNQISDIAGIIIADEVADAASKMTIAWRKINA